MARQRFEMTQAQLDKVLDACKPVPLIAIHCGMPRSPQENANAAWASLGAEMGFNHMSVQPTGEGDRFFTAEPVACKGLEIEPGVHSGCSAADTGATDCPTCGT